MISKNHKSKSATVSTAHATRENLLAQSAIMVGTAACVTSMMIWKRRQRPRLQKEAPSTSTKMMKTIKSSIRRRFTTKLSTNHLLADVVKVPKRIKKMSMCLKRAILMMMMIIALPRWMMFMTLTVALLVVPVRRALQALVTIANLLPPMLTRETATQARVILQLLQLRIVRAKIRNNQSLQHRQTKEASWTVFSGHSSGVLNGLCTSLSWSSAWFC